MNIEREVKFQIKEKSALRSRILELGAILKGTASYEDIYFTVPQAIERTKYLRIRIKDDNANAVLAYHEVVNDLETKEWEINIDNAKITHEILNKLGFKLDVTVIKKRETMILGSSNIVFDNVRGLGDFIEIEAPTQRMLNKIIKNLGIKEEDVVSGLGYPDLIKEKGVK